MRAVLLREVGAIENVDVDEPAPGEGEVVVDVAVAGVCGSDVHAARDGGLLRTPPLVMGHEIAGMFQGRRVAINPIISCHACDMCKRRMEHLCRNRTIVGIQRAGGLAAKVAVPQENLVDLPPTVSMEAGAMVEPLAVAHHAIRLAPLVAGDRVGILGAGTIGLLVAYLLRGQDYELEVADLDDHRLGFARSLGIEAVGRELDGEFDIVFDAVGNRTTHRLSLELLRPGGTAVWIGNEEADPAFDAQMLVRVEQRVVGSAAYHPDDFVGAARLISDEVLEWATVLPLEEAPRVIGELMDPQPGGPVKVLFRP